MFDVLPAIDLRGGRVVRLAQGDFERETVYSGDPLDVARSFAEAGARWLHVVDLDGARGGGSRQSETAGAIIEAAGENVAVEVAGGLRGAGAVARMIDLGAARVVLGTAAVRDPAFAGTIARHHGSSRVAVALDIGNGRVLADGWRKAAGDQTPEVLVARLAAEGIETFEVTAVNRDGLLGGPDLDLLSRIVGLETGRVIASGGIASLDDVRAVRAIGCQGVIVGRSLYEGRVELKTALGLEVT